MIINLTKNLLVFVSLFYVTFYVPFVLTSYNPYWVKYGCNNLHQRCEKIGYEKAGKAIDNLTSFLAHRDDLGNQWRENEKLHLDEVRVMMDVMFILAALAVVILLILRRKVPRFYKFAAVNVLVAICLFIVLLVMPNFKTFWINVFHPLLFDNDLWIVTRKDTLYYIMPRIFFKVTTAVILSSWVILNIMVILLSLLRKTENKGLIKR